VSLRLNKGLLSTPFGPQLLLPKRLPLKKYSSTVMRGLDPRIHFLAKENGLPGQAPTTDST
jgi:hypothetical protein